MARIETIDIHKYAETLREMDRAMATTVHISHDQVLRIVVSDLIGKYKSCVVHGHTDKAQNFRAVLSYYLDTDEMTRYVDGDEWKS